MGATVRKVGVGIAHAFNLIREITHDGCVTKIRTGSIRNVHIYVRYQAPLALETMARAGDLLGLDCSDGWKKAAQQQARLPLVLGVPAISSRISPTTVNIRPTAPVLILVTRPSCVNLANSIKCVGDSRSYLSYHRSHYALLMKQVHVLRCAAGPNNN